MLSAVRVSLFETQERREKLEGIGDPLAQFERHLNFAAITAKVDVVAPRPPQPKGGRPPYPTEVMVRLLVIQHLLNLSDEPLEFQILERESFRRFAGRDRIKRHPGSQHRMAFQGAHRCCRCGERGIRRGDLAVGGSRLHRLLWADHRHQHCGGAPATSKS